LAATGVAVSQKRERESRAQRIWSPGWRRLLGKSVRDETERGGPESTQAC
jgi:hypothetical protein